MTTSQIVPLSHMVGLVMPWDYSEEETDVTFFPSLYEVRSALKEYAALAASMLQDQECATDALASHGWIIVDSNLEVMEHGTLLDLCVESMLTVAA